MEQFKLQVPEGMQDFLPDACRHKRQLEEAMRRLFAAHGYDELETPLLEYLDVFTGGIGAIAPERLCKLIDHRGRILAVRPESTMPIARVAATRLKNAPLPLRLCYVQAQMLYQRQDQARSYAQMQAGIELIGEAGVYADAEVIAVAIQALKRSGLAHVQIEIGQAEYFKGLMEEAGIAPAQTEQLRQYVEEKNMLAIELLLRNLAVAADARERILQLPNLYGGIEVLDTALALSKHPRCVEAIDGVRALVTLLEAYGYRDCLSIDLGMVHSIHYYSGMIFRGITSGLGQPLLSGGRYDHVIEEFGSPTPATGFALRIDQVLEALERERALTPVPPPDVCIGFDPACLKEALLKAEALRGQGLNVVMSYERDVEAAAAQAQARNIKQMLYIQKYGQIVRRNRGED